MANTFCGSTPTAKVLEPHIGGGGRVMKRFERRIGSYAVPGAGAKLDNYGNLKRSELVEALSGVGAFPDTGQSRTVRSGRSKHEHVFQRSQGFCQVSKMVRIENPNDPEHCIDVPRLVCATLPDGSTIDFT